MVLVHQMLHVVVQLPNLWETVTATQVGKETQINWLYREDSSHHMQEDVYCTRVVVIASHLDTVTS